MINGVQTVREREHHETLNLSELIEKHKKSKSKEPLTIDVEFSFVYRCKNGPATKLGEPTVLNLESNS